MRRRKVVICETDLGGIREERMRIRGKIRRGRLGIRIRR
jgi:hypothetical protein